MQPTSLLEPGTGLHTPSQDPQTSTGLQQGTKARKRRWAPKARSGCTTCRIRRVKCDEEKPACKRCSSTGRKCDGYDPSRRPILTILHQPEPSTAPPRVKPTWDELHMFHFFSTEVAGKISGPFDQAFWTIDVLRAARLHPCLWHACNALAAMYRKYTIPRSKCRVRQIEERHETLALVQYNASIRALVALTNQTDPGLVEKSVILATTVLYTGFCSLRGCQKEVFMHTRNGLNLFQQWRTWEQVEEPRQILPVASLVTLFNRLDSQALSLMDDASRPNWQTNGLPQEVSDKPFANTTEAYFEFELLLNGFLDLMQCKEPIPWTEIHGPIFVGQLSYRRAFEKWSAKLTALQRSGLMCETDREALLSLQIRHLTARMAANMDLNVHQLRWDVFQEEFDLILSLSEKLLECYYGPSRTGPSSPEATRIPTFSFAASLCEPLFLIGLNCRDRAARRKAIDLLRRWPRREGIWDTDLAAAVTEASMLVEEGGAAQCLLKEGDVSACECLPELYVCHEHRVVDLNLEILGEGIARLTLQTARDVVRGKPGRVIGISW